MQLRCRERMKKRRTIEFDGYDDQKKSLFVNDGNDLHEMDCLCQCQYPLEDYLTYSEDLAFFLPASLSHSTDLLSDKFSPNTQYTNHGNNHVKDTNLEY